MLLTIFLIVAGIAFVESQSSAIPNPQITALYFTGSETNGQIFGPFGDGTAWWQIAQWTNPSPIDNSSVITRGQGPCHDPSTSWFIANSNTRVCVSEGSNLVELAQSSAGLPCGPSYEYDLFLSPIGGYGGINVNWNKMPPLGQLNYINLSFNAQLLFVNVQSHCGSFPECSSAPDYAYSTAAVILGNGTDTLFYQIILLDTRGMNAQWGCSGFDSGCTPMTGWFATQNPFGVNQAMGNYEGACLDDMQPHSFNYNILPNLQNLISSGVISGADWQTWTLGGTYIGLGGNGLYAATLLVSDYNIVFG